MRSCNRHIPPIIQEGRARAGQSTSCARWGKAPYPTVTSHAKIGGGAINGHKVVYCTCKCIEMFFLIPIFFHPHFLTSMRSCNGHAPPIIQEGRACAGQSTSRAGWDRAPHPTVTSHAEGGGRNRGVTLVGAVHGVALVSAVALSTVFPPANVSALANIYSLLFLFFLHLNFRSNL
jgi:hypothetical protein